MKKIKATRYIYTIPYMQTEGIYEQVSGYDIEIYPWIQTFVAKRHDSWTVYESTTGKNIHGGKTIEKAVANAKEYLDRVGEIAAVSVISKTARVPFQPV